ncbi:hypothetical protein M5D96_009455 [Drosophila gunungcola]|uniref:Yellow-k n=1 Tax=Drosophila gunungcola TaxID=103775 RepID=A0A9Q0BNH9_9MUSC|nr:hypothetical protein M5D96_009455 [Drosophila gunungcola]
MVTQVVLCLGVLLVGLALASEAWLLSQSDLNESSYYVRHLSMHFSRVFLSVNVESNEFATLIEAQWPVSYFPMPTVVFPNADVHANGDHDDCSLLQQAHWSQVDALSRLWVMDIGVPGSRCPPRLFAANDTQSLVVQMGPKGPGCEQERHIYFIVGHGAGNSRLRRPGTDMATSPIAKSQGELILCDQDGDLYSTVDRLEMEGKHELLSTSIENSIKLTHLGSLLGSSRSMIIDNFGTLYYVIPKFGAVVRCAKLANITAEGNEIIYLTSKNIQQIFFTSNDALWVLSDRVLNAQDMCFPSL